MTIGVCKTEVHGSSRDADHEDQHCETDESSHVINTPLELRD
jgi:hypothetical protein